MLLSAQAAAQDAPDPRLSGPMIQALQAQVALQAAIIKAMGEDAEAQKAELWLWFLESKKEAAPKDR